LRFRALASDYDLTLVKLDHLDAATIVALRRLKASGRKLVLVTGRTVAYAYGPRGILTRDVALLFDRIVGENGATMWNPRTDEMKVLGTPPSPEFLKRLTDAGVQDGTVGLASVHVPRRYRAVAAGIVRDLGLPQHAIAGTGHDVYVDKGIDKASGLRIALAELGLTPDQAVAVGDGPNDVAMLDRRHSGVGLGIAIGDGSAEAKAVADLVTIGGPGAGVREVVEALIRHDLQHGLGPAPRGLRGFDGLDAA